MMDKKTIAWIKATFPGLFAMVVKSPFITRLALEADRLRYFQSLYSNKPYFGTICLAGQTWEERKPWMRKLVALEVAQSKQKNLSFLEVGSWAGNSAVLWADSLKANDCTGIVLCVDAWEPYMKASDFDQTNVATRLMNEDLSRGKIFKLFLHNIKAAGYAETIFPFKGSSNHILPRLLKQSFDVIYLDGDHRYQQFMKDLSYANDLVKVGGVICGDDLDLTLDEVDANYARSHAEVNVVVDPRTAKVYHPGISLACNDFFKVPVRSYNGFWAMRKKLNGWEQIVL